ncbi:hypothetical protein K525DRAFT_258394 [Schizophyllum commune Loenen D]|nr:hypothetical protein K525DRAFT_258394 [Schizophyllum commune Loenen D]
MSFVKAFVAVLALSTASVDALRPSLHGRAHSNWRHHNTVRPRATTYTLKDKFDSSNILDEFDFWHSEDPTHGSVNYLGKDEATEKKLAYVDNGVVVLAVDDTTWLPSGGNRDSVRISSKANYDNGLFIADFEAMPWGCSVWPAYWSNGPNWPAGGEIDVLEGVNEATTNQYTLHTSDGCSASAGNAKITANLGNAKCASANGDNAGCAYFDTDNRSYGKGFNEAGGGVYAHLIDSTGIKIWFFSRSDVPQDITSGNPDPSSWDSPAAFWATETCDIASHFYSQQLIIDTTLCGDWAGSSFNSDGCSGSCADTVADPGNFKNAKWRINSIKVYQAGGDGGDDSGSGSSDGASSTDWWSSETISASLGLTISAGNVNAQPTDSVAPTSTAWSSAATATSTGSPDNGDDEDCDDEDDGQDDTDGENANDEDDGEDCDDEGDDSASGTAASSAAGASSTGTSSEDGDDCDDGEGASATATGSAAASSSTSVNNGASSSNSGSSSGNNESDDCDDEGSDDGSRAATSGSAGDASGVSATGSSEGASATGTSKDDGDDCDDEEGSDATATATGTAAASSSSSTDGEGDCDEGEWSYSAYPSASASGSAFPSGSASAFASASGSGAAFPSASGSAAGAGSGTATFYQPSGSASFAYSSAVAAASSAPAATSSPECTESA